jgi:tRNA(fMet)-specific endonuclease VapC
MKLLDTSFLIDYFKGVEVARGLVTADEQHVTTAITYHEIMTGLKRAHARKEESFFKRVFSQMTVLEFDEKAAEESSTIAAKLEVVAKSVNALDIPIAGVAVANGISKIVTRDRDFLEIAKVAEIDVLTYWISHISSMCSKLVSRNIALPDISGD